MFGNFQTNTVCSFLADQLRHRSFIRRQLVHDQWNIGSLAQGHVLSPCGARRLKDEVQPGWQQSQHAQCMLYRQATVAINDEVFLGAGICK
ncbi:hypothetical protein D3C71_874290 [compost metagenome]